MIIIKNVFGGSQVYIKSIYNDVETVIVYNGGDPIETGGGGGGVTDHGALTGLADDDHTQYHNDARGDARYVALTSGSSQIITQTGLNSGFVSLGGEGSILGSNGTKQAAIVPVSQNLFFYDGTYEFGLFAPNMSSNRNITLPDATGTVSLEGHTHSQSDITNLVTDLSGKAASSHTHPQSDITNLTTDLAGKAATSHTHAQSDITSLVSDLAAKVTGNVAITGATKTKVTYDSKGLITAGTDAAVADITGLQTALDAKVAGNGAITGATKTKITYDAKGLVTAGADIAASDLPTGIDATKIADGSVTSTEFQYINTVTSNVQTQIDGKQATLVSGTNLRTVNGNTLLGSTNIATYDDEFMVQTGLGWTGKAQTFPLQLMTATSYTLLTTQLDLVSIYLREASTLTGVTWLQVVNGSYTASNYNGVGLYSYSGGTLTLVASSTNDANIWAPGSTGVKQKAFSSTYAAAQGVYYIGLLYSRSAATTAPTIGNRANGPTTMTNTPFTNSAKLTGFVGSQTSLPSSQAMSGVSNQAVYPWVGLY